MKDAADKFKKTGVAESASSGEADLYYYARKVWVCAHSAMLAGCAVRTFRSWIDHMGTLVLLQILSLHPQKLIDVDVEGDLTVYECVSANHADPRHVRWFPD